jgi:hypothetical protein
VSLADELEKLAGEADLANWRDKSSAERTLSRAVIANLPAIIQALREREAIVRWLRNDATRAWGADPVPRDEISFVADAIEAGEHLKGEA